MMSSASLRTIVQKMENPDPDYRYMATSDLLDFLCKTGLRSCDADTQACLCFAVVRLLADSSSEVQGMAQRCLPLLSTQVESQHAKYLVESLLDYVLLPADVSNRGTTGADVADETGQKALRDVSCLGLKSIINELPPPPTSATQSIAVHMLPRLLHAVSSHDEKADIDILIDALEVLQALLVRAAGMVTSLHDNMRKILIPRVGSTRLLVSKRAISCIAIFAPASAPSVFSAIVEEFIEQLQSRRSSERVHSAVQALWAISKTSGHRLSPNIEVIVPLLISLCTGSEYREDDELREHSLQALEAFIERCPQEMLSFSETLVSVLTSLVKYDPNYAGSDIDSDGDESMREGQASDDDVSRDDGDDYDIDDDDDDYTDDDDTSWKVRRAAVHCIHGMIDVQFKPPNQIVDDFGKVLVSRFKEREETVKLEVFDTFKSLLRLIAATELQAQRTRTGARRSDESAISDSCALPLSAISSVTLPFLSKVAPRTLRSLRAELGAKSVKCRISALLLLRDLVAISPATYSSEISRILPKIDVALSDSSTQVKTEALQFVRGVLESHCAETLKDHVSHLVPRILETANDRYYKITAESLDVVSRLLVYFGSAGNDETRAVLFAHVPSIYDAALQRLSAQDQDSEVKQVGIYCVGVTAALYGDSVGKERLDSVGGVLCDRLGNEVTRLAAVRALIRIAESKNSSALNPVMDGMTTTIGSFLRKNDAALRLASLELLASLPFLSPANDKMLLLNAGNLVSDADLRLAALALRLCSRLVRARGSPVCSLLTEESDIFEKALELIVSPLLQGRAVASLLDFFLSVAEVNSAPLSVHNLILSVRSKTLDAMDKSTPSVRVTGTTALTSVQCAAKCISVICQGSSATDWASFVDEFIQKVSSGSVPERILALFSLGELGRRSLLNAVPKAKTSAERAIIGALDATEEEISAAAAVALGGVSSGDGASGVPDLVALIRERSDIKYLLLLALKEAIAFADRKDLNKYVSTLLQVLTEQGLEKLDERERVENTEVHGALPGDAISKRGLGQESVKIATAECLGHLAFVDANTVFEALRQGAKSESAVSRSYVISSLKSIVAGVPAESEQSTAVQANLRSDINQFLKLADDPEVSVRASAMHAINAISRAQPVLLIDHLSDVLPMVYKATVKNSELVRMVDLGPFKYEEDHGLDLRKAGYDVMRTLITGPLVRFIDLYPFLEALVAGLGDVADVRSIAQLTLCKVCEMPVAATPIIRLLDRILSALESALREKLRENAVRQERERHEDSLKGALRTVQLLEKIPDVACNVSYVSFRDRVLRSSELGNKYNALVGSSSDTGAQ